MMQRFLNDPDDIVDETVRGFVRAHADLVKLHPRTIAWSCPTRPASRAAWAW
jgi:dihydroxyacetone kinase